MLYKPSNSAWRERRKEEKISVLVYTIVLDNFPKTRYIESGFIQRTQFFSWFYGSLRFPDNYIMERDYEADGDFYWNLLQWKVLTQQIQALKEGIEYNPVMKKCGEQDIYIVSAKDSFLVAAEVPGQENKYIEHIKNIAKQFCRHS